MVTVHKNHKFQTGTRHPEVLGENALSLEGRRPLTISKSAPEADHPSRPARLLLPYLTFIAGARAPQDDGPEVVARQSLVTARLSPPLCGDGFQNLQCLG